MPKRSLIERIEALTASRDEVHVVIGTSASPCMVLVNGKPAPDYVMPTHCELTIANPREPLGDEASVPAPLRASARGWTGHS